MQDALSELLAHAVKAGGHLHLEDRALLSRCLNGVVGHDDARLSVAEHSQSQHPHHVPFLLVRYEAAMALQRPAEYFSGFREQCEGLARPVEPGPEELRDLMKEALGAGDDPEAGMEVMLNIFQSRQSESKKLTKLRRTVSAYLKKSKGQKVGDKRAPTQLGPPGT